MYFISHWNGMFIQKHCAIGNSRRDFGLQPVPSDRFLHQTVSQPTGIKRADDYNTEGKGARHLELVRVGECEIVGERERERKKEAIKKGKKNERKKESEKEKMEQRQSSPPYTVEEKENDENAKRKKHGNWRKGEQ
ncbi:Hypothetical predicted protein [Octopus vulgaris]|uniref:Uncharacterized protein n=1 Tax=Octopus vulgaris TaxID=6645 RepID=A0AA36F0A1_OCTVU|nr:Hypothetical predicted protein [Octopus vulgaris]